MPPVALNSLNTPNAYILINSELHAFYTAIAKAPRCRPLLRKHVFFFFSLLLVVCLQLTRVNLFVNIHAFNATGGIRFFFERLGVLDLLSLENRVYRSFARYEFDMSKDHKIYRSSSSASWTRFAFNISTACFQRREMTSGASFE